MYRKPSPQMTIDDFILPFSGGLSADNRWVRLAKIIPWDEIEREYAFMFPSDRGNVAKPVRMALDRLSYKHAVAILTANSCSRSQRIRICSTLSDSRNTN